MDQAMDAMDAMDALDAAVGDLAVVDAAVDVLGADGGPDQPAERPTMDTAPVSPAPCAEPGGRVDPGTGRCYFMPSMSAMIWPDARVACEGRGAHLATLTSPAEQAFALSLLGTEELWIGLYRTGTGPWQWVTGEPASFMAWAPLEPDEPSDGSARLSGDGWHDTDVRRRFLTLCERDP